MSPMPASSSRSPAVSMLFSRRVVVGRASDTTPRAATAACAAAWAASTPPNVVAGAGIAALGLPEVNLANRAPKQARGKDDYALLYETACCAGWGRGKLQNVPDPGFVTIFTIT